jgi:hypothetical protein
VAREIARLGHQVAEALARAHALGIVHRDVKSDNLLVTASGHADAPSVRLIDFGIAKAPPELFSVATDQAFTRYWTELGTIMGSPPYMAPEQNGAAQTVTGRADVYALGVALLISVLNLDAESLETGERSLVLPQDLPGLFENTGELGAVWCELLTGMLAPNPEARPQMSEVALRLQALSRADVEFARAVETWKKTGRVPPTELLSRFLEHAESLGPLTVDEESFLRHAPLARLRGNRRNLRRTLLVAAVLSALVVGAGMLRTRTSVFERIGARLGLESSQRQTTTEALLPQGEMQHELSAAGIAGERSFGPGTADGEHSDARLGQAKAELERVQAAREAADKRAVELEREVEAFKQRALFAERAVGDLKTEQGTAKARIEQLCGKVTSLEGQVGQAR